MTDDCRTIEGLELTILLPCLNEAETIEICVEKAMSFETALMLLLTAGHRSSPNAHHPAYHESAKP